MQRYLPILGLVVLLNTSSAFGQGVVSDVLSGKLVKPEVGVWAWYELKEPASEETYLVRLAVVDEEEVGRKKGFWIEFEVVPMLGYPSIHKMLVTGPASNPRNVHKLLQRVGTSLPEVIPIGDDRNLSEYKPPKSKRTLIGKEDVETPDGTISAEHYQVKSGNETSDVWLNEDVRPMGIVRLVSPNGELNLRSYGTGGDNARSIINDPPAHPQTAKQPKVNVKVRVADPATPGSKVEEKQ